MQRRNFMEAVAALAATRWEDEGYDPENIDGWEPMKPGVYTTGEFTPSMLITSGEGGVGNWLIEDDDLDSRSLDIHYDSGGIQLSLEGTGDGALRGGTLAELQPEQARQAAAALYQAAEELDARRGTDGDE